MESVKNILWSFNDFHNKNIICFFFKGNFPFLCDNTSFFGGGGGDFIQSCHSSMMMMMTLTLNFSKIYHSGIFLFRIIITFFLPNQIHHDLWIIVKKKNLNWFDWLSNQLINNIPRSSVGKRISIWFSWWLSTLIMISILSIRISSFLEFQKFQFLRRSITYILSSIYVDVVFVLMLKSFFCEGK